MFPYISKLISLGFIEFTHMLNCNLLVISVLNFFMATDSAIKLIFFFQCQYKVRAYNLAGHCDSQCYIKLALLSPSFSKSLGRALTVEEGEPIELKCKIEASPSAQIKW